jgi:hypothetical protein
MCTKKQTVYKKFLILCALACGITIMTPQEITASIFSNICYRGKAACMTTFFAATALIFYKEAQYLWLNKTGKFLKSTGLTAENLASQLGGGKRLASVLTWGQKYADTIYGTPKTDIDNTAEALKQGAEAVKKTAHSVWGKVRSLFSRKKQQNSSQEEAKKEASLDQPQKQQEPYQKDQQEEEQKEQGPATTSSWRAKLRGAFNTVTYLAPHWIKNYGSISGTAQEQKMFAQKFVVHSGATIAAAGLAMLSAYRLIRGHA